MNYGNWIELGGILLSAVVAIFVYRRNGAL
jgi:hypothetical protein